MQDTPFVLLSSLLLLRSSCFMYGGNPMVESGHASTAASLTLCCDVVQALRPHHFLPLSILTPSPSPLLSVSSYYLPLFCCCTRSPPSCKWASLCARSSFPLSLLPFFSPSHLLVVPCSVFCPAGCKEVKGDIWGRSEPGYRDVSVTEQPLSPLRLLTRDLKALEALLLLLGFYCLFYPFNHLICLSSLRYFHFYSSILLTCMFPLVQGYYFAHKEQGNKECLTEPCLQTY